MAKDVKVFMSESDFDNLTTAGGLLKEINGIYDSKLTILSTQNILVDENGEFMASPSVYSLREGEENLLSCEDSSSFALYLKGYKRAMDKATEAMNNAFNLDSLDDEEEETSAETEDDAVEEEVSTPAIEEEEEENTAPESDTDSENE